MIIDDEKNLRWALEKALNNLGYEVKLAASGEEGLDLLKKGSPDLVLVDLKMPGIDGLTTLARIKEISPETPVVVMTAHGTIETAVQAMKEGALDFLTKPFEISVVDAVIKKTLRLTEMKKEMGYLRQELATSRGYGKIIGKSPAIRQVMSMAEKVAATSATVLLRGESGTGKELIAQSIHELGDRRERPFVKVNCAALPEQLLESELFGYEKGAFTGAQARKPGRFDRAQGGTIFLDEIGEISPAMQAKLLRVLQEKEFERVGGVETVKADVRVITATNQNLEAAVHNKTFREDLFYRLNVFPIMIPPLRERREDVAELARFFLERAGREIGRQPISIPPQVQEVLDEYYWPGNVRELQNLMERVSILSTTGWLDIELLPPEILSGNRVKKEIQPDNQEAAAFILPQKGVSIDEVERDLIQQALTQASGNQTQAAQLLGITRYTLIYRMAKYGIK